MGVVREPHPGWEAAADSLAYSQMHSEKRAMSHRDMSRVLPPSLAETTSEGAEAVVALEVAL